VRICSTDFKKSFQDLTN